MGEGNGERGGEGRVREEMEGLGRAKVELGI